MAVDYFVLPVGLWMKVKIMREKKAAMCCAVSRFALSDDEDEFLCGNQYFKKRHFSKHRSTYVLASITNPKLKIEGKFRANFNPMVPSHI